MLTQRCSHLLRSHGADVAYIRHFRPSRRIRRGEGAALAGGEGGLGVCGVDDVVDDVGIAAAGDVVEAAANGQVVAQEVKALFELQI